MSTKLLNRSNRRNVAAKPARRVRAKVQSSFETLEGRTLFAGDFGAEAFSSALLTKATKMKLEPAVVAGLNGGFTSFSVTDASYDSTKLTAFDDGAVRVNFAGQFRLGTKVTVEALKDGTVVKTVGKYIANGFKGALVSLGGFSGFSPGEYTFRATGKGVLGISVSSTSQPLDILPVTTQVGTFGGETLNYGSALGSGTVVFGLGGTDTLNLGTITKADVKNLDNVWGTGLNDTKIVDVLNPNLSNVIEANPPGVLDNVVIKDAVLATDLVLQLDPLINSTDNQAIYRGTSFDHLTLHDGREIYFQGIEVLQFADGTLDLTRDANDTSYGDQWNHFTTDVPGAWRFSKGADNVLLVSLDTGVLTQAGASGGIHDLTMSRLVTDATDNDGFMDYGHGHCSISVMSSTGNNNSMVAGINRVSDVFVADVYNGVSLQTAITDAINYANDRGMKVVFQGGIQGEGWLTSGGTQNQLKALINNNKANTFFSIAAGNGGPGGNLNDANYLNSVSGVAKLQSQYGNVASIGALRMDTTQTIDGKINAASVSLASYSNRGSNLTIVAPTNSPAADKNGSVRTFGGTSCANPNLAGMASLVWSVNSSLTGSEVRNILTSTTMDLGAAGRDNTFGAGLVNTEAAVRKAWALGKDAALVNLPDQRLVLPILDYIAFDPKQVIGPDPVIDTFIPQLDLIKKVKVLDAQVSAEKLATVRSLHLDQLKAVDPVVSPIDVKTVDPKVIDSNVIDSKAIVNDSVSTVVTDAVKTNVVDPSLFSIKNIDGLKLDSQLVLR